jgi:hypothetical protein
MNEKKQRESATTAPTAARRFAPLLVVILVLTGLTAGGYFLTKRFIAERQALLMPMTRAQRPGGFVSPRRPVTQTRTYTREEIEKARKEGKSLPGLTQPGAVPAANTAGEAAVQRSLRTLDEINKINQLNQGLLVQKQRIKNNPR